MDGSKKDWVGQGDIQLFHMYLFWCYITCHNKIFWITNPDCAIYTDWPLECHIGHRMPLIFDNIDKESWSKCIFNQSFGLVGHRMKFVLLSALLLLAGNTLAQDDCTVDHCLNEYKAVVDIEGGMEALLCSKSCDLVDLLCAYNCGLFNTSIPTHKLFQCRSDNDCYPEDTPTVGTWIGTNQDAETDIAQKNFLSGDWYNVKGNLPMVYMSYDWLLTWKPVQVWTAAMKKTLVRITFRALRFTLKLPTWTRYQLKPLAQFHTVLPSPTQNVCLRC